MINKVVSDRIQDLSQSSMPLAKKRPTASMPLEPRTDRYTSNRDERFEQITEPTKQASKTFTETMARSLAEKYDVTKMTRNQFSSLLGELRNMGLISAREFSVGYSGTIPQSGPEGQTVYMGAATAWPAGQEQADFTELLQMAKADCQKFVVSQPENSTESVSGNTVLDSYCRISELFEQLKTVSQGKDLAPMGIHQIANHAASPLQTSSYKTATASPRGTQFQELLTAQFAATAVQDTKSLSAAEAELDTTIYPTDSVEVKLEKLAKIAETADYTGMTYSEIYTEIWNRYDAAFDGKLSAITSLLIPMPNEWTYIANQFNSEAGAAVFTPLYEEFVDQGYLKDGEFFYTNPHVRQVYSDIQSAPYGYAGLSYEEKQQLIYEKYKNCNTYLDFMSMQGELQNTLVTLDRLGPEGESNYRFALDMQLTYFYFYPKENLLERSRGTNVSPESLLSDADWNRILNEPFDTVTFLSGLKESLHTIHFPTNTINMESVISSQIDELLHLFDKNRKSDRV